MSTPVGTKSKKKQPASSKDQAPAIENTGEQSHAFEQALLQLEDACALILDAPPSLESENTESLYWEQRFQNSVTPLSLALAECKGPRKFHYHYRRREDDESVLHPVMENPLDTLAQVCRQALDECRGVLATAHEKHLDSRRRILETALQSFLASYKSLEQA
jgi:hypothetical protein